MASGDLPVAQGEIIEARSVNQLWAAGSWSKNYLSGGDAYSMLMFSATNWQHANKESSDGGSTWTSGGPGSSYLGVICEADKTKAVAYTAAGAVKITTDSGSTWTAASAAPGNLSYPIGVAFRTAGMCIMWGAASSGKGAWYSTDGGDNWTQMTDATLTATIEAMDFIDANDGIATDSSQNILWTSTGVAGWADTTHNTVGVLGQNIRLINSGASLTDYDAIIICRDNSGGSEVCGEAYSYDGSGAPTERFPNTIADGAFSAQSQILQTDDGNHYYAVSLVGSRGHIKRFLYRSKDSGITWDTRLLPVSGEDLNSSRPAWINNSTVTYGRSYYSNVIAQFENKLLIVGQTVLEVDESYID
jgi:photosystem II stability/assembly factor-like uncharacterized protein|tara:strand:+ start:399 stop:1478 length:1080 start_codon:yes stop_codon:yes gene_type:complete